MGVAARAEQLRALGRRGRLVLVIAGLTGGATGLAVAGFEWVTRDALFGLLAHQAVAVRVLAPLAGLLVAAGALQWIAKNPSPATADEYIRNVHEVGRRMDLRPLPGRILASIATLGSGGSMGYEGPSIYLGAGIGSALQARFSRMFSRDDAKVLLVAGAAAGVSAIFRAPATGLVFALEVPFQEGFGRRHLLPAGVAAATSYLVYAAFYGTAPLIPVSGSPPFNLTDLLGAVVLGAVCGLAARWFARALVGAKHIASRWNPWARALAGGLGLAASASLAYAVFGSPYTLGAGYDNLDWAFNPHRAVALVVGLLLLRGAATVLTVAGGGSGGLFIPLVIEGALVGRSIGGLFRTSSTASNFFPLIGVSAFLGAGYRVPLAAVVFAAEATGRPGFIVPGLLAAVVAQLFVGSASVSPFQMAAQAGHLERRFPLPIASVLNRDIASTPPDTTLEEFVKVHALRRREHAVPVLDAGGTYRGMVRVEEVIETPKEDWPTVTVADRMRTDFPVAEPTWRLRDALRAMEQADVDLLPVVEQGRFIGVVTTAEILKLDDILKMTTGEET
ncbi:MAG TPA: chloride channel protein [Actinomycetota bacterium]|nr:chloride channel protein [Actinomycetota bacterium]